VFFLILVLVCLALMVLLWAGTTWFQGYIYEGVAAADLYWRAPAAAVALTLFLGLWSWLAYRAPGSVPGLFQFSFSNSNQDKPYSEFWTETQGKENHYTVQKIAKAGRTIREYRDAQSKVWPPSVKPDVLLVKEGEEKVRFEAKKGNAETATVYIDSRGRVIKEDDPGQFTLFSWGLLFKNLFVYSGFLVVWFACLWLLLRFQWSHALGLAVVLWLVGVMLLVPPLIEQAEKKAAETPPATSGLTAMSNVFV